MSRMCYVAEPCDFGALGPGAMDRAVNELTLAGMFAFWPRMAFSGTGAAEPDFRVRQVNYRALSQADCMLAFLPEDVRTIGVPMEIEQAISQLGIPVAVVGGKSSWALARPNVFITESIAVAVAFLDDVTVEGAKERRRLPMFVQSNHAEAHLPDRAHRGDAGFDLYVTEETVIQGSSFADVPCGISIELPEPYWGLIFGRSSTIRKRGLLVTPGIIDNGYRGEIYSPVYNMGLHPVTVGVGERLAQFIPMSLTAGVLEPRWTETLGESDRGTNGFGSTGA